MSFVRRSRSFLALSAVALALAPSLGASGAESSSAPAVLPSAEGRPGEALARSAFGPSVIEDARAVLERMRLRGDMSARDQTPPEPGSPLEATKLAPLPPSAGPFIPQGGGGTAPPLTLSFQGPVYGDTGATTYPPDTCGAVGTNHFLAATNFNVSGYSKVNGTRVLNVSLNAFFNTGAFIGDPRVAFDAIHSRWILLCSDFSALIYFAYSLTDDPTGNWFKTTINFAQGTDAGSWPDYPTLGYDQNGIYMASYMVGGSLKMSIFAVDVAPLLGATPSLGTVTAWRNLPFEGSIQPCVTHGTPAGEYLVSLLSATSLRLRRVNPPLSAPTLSELGGATVPSYVAPPDAPQLGTGTLLDTLDGRLMNAVYRAGSVWTAHAVSVSGRSACRWYQIDVGTVSALQVGTIDDPTIAFMEPTLDVNSTGIVALGFSGSSSTQYASSYFTGRLPTDPAGQMGAPVLLHAGAGADTQASRWGDYSLTCVDPTNDSTLWTIQEYATAAHNWGNRIAELGSCIGGLPDCNANGIQDGCDLAAGTSIDSNANGIPDECEPVIGNSYCAGDGNDPTVSNFCPCFNLGAAGRGCASSVAANGALLSISGALHPTDSLVLTATSLPSSALAIFIKGSANIVGGIVFGDGIRCAGGTLIRFGTQNAVAGVASYPQGAQPLISIVGGTPPLSGTNAYYQLYYRDPDASFCPPATFNVSNAWHLVW